MRASFEPETAFPEGRPVPVDASRSIDLSDSAEVWVVERGEVLVFAVERHEGDGAGRRHFLCSLEPGEVAFGTAPAAGRLLGMTLIMTGAGQALTRAVSRDELSRRSRETEHPRGEAPLVSIEEMIEHWVTAFTSQIGEALTDSDIVTLPEHGSLTLAPTAPVRPDKGAKWVSVTRGALSFLDTPGAAWTSTDPPMPISWRGWARAIEDSEIEVLSRDEVEGRGLLWDGLERFTDLALRALEEAVAKSDTELDRLRTAELDQAAAASDEAVSALASVLPERRREVREPARDPLVVAIRLVARTIGVEVQPEAAISMDDSVERRIHTIAERSQCLSRRVALPDRWWQDDHGSLIGFLGDDAKPVALLRRRGGYHLVDPGSATEYRVDAAAARQIARYGYVLTRRLSLEARHLSDVVKLGLKGTGVDISRIVIFGIVGGLASLATPVISEVIFNSVVPQNDTRRLLGVTLTLVVIAVAVAFGSTAQGIALVRVRARFNSSSQTALWDRLLALPAGFFQRYSVGELVTRSQSLDAVDNLLSDATIAGLLSGMFMMFNVFLMLTLGWFLAIVGIGMVAIQTVVVLSIAYRNVGIARRQQVANNQLQAVTFELIRGVSKLKVAGAEPRAFAAWAKRFVAQRRLVYASGRLTAANSVFTTVWPTLTTLGIVASIAAVGRSHVSTGEFMLFTSAFTQSSTALALVAVNAGIVALCIPLLEQVRPILEARVEVDTSRQPPGELRGEIALSHVSFRYAEDGPLVLDDVSMEVAPGEMVAVVGPSGAGKSSMLRLLLGFELPDSGTVSYDGRDLSGLDVNLVRRQIGTVIQGAQLLPGTILSNLAGGRTISRDEAWAAAEAAGIADDIRAMPMGMETLVTEASGSVSGGQRQRLLIARALVSRPRILFFDEATSALDNVTQEMVSQSVARLKISRVIIAHRLSTIEQAQRIYVLDAGRIVEQGTLEELRGQPGLFADLVRRQLVE